MAANIGERQTERVDQHGSRVTGHSHRRLIFADPVAFRYLEEDPSTTVLERQGELQGYQLYLVEQWACSRTHPTFIITTFTGLPQHKINVDVLGVPTDQSLWSPRLRIYLNAVSQSYARERETLLGTVMITNLSSFPSALTVIAVPGGAMRKHRERFFVNENLKRVGCSGRAGLSLSPPNDATQAKFLQLYRTSELLQPSIAVIELVKLCQAALVMFTKLSSEYADGLLCDVTERAINDWWTEVGAEYFNVEPSDGILGPTTVAALLGLFLGARNRLNAYGAPVAKDAFDLRATKRGLAWFQKAQKIPRTRRLDRRTLERLHKITSKAANNGGWAVSRVVKSGVAELGGKGGEMVMDMVGGRDKAGIAEVESINISTFIERLSGDRCKWIWQGKSRKLQNNDLFNGLAQNSGMIFKGNEKTGYVWENVNRAFGITEDHSTPRKPDLLDKRGPSGSQDSFDASYQDTRKKNVLKTVTGRVNDAKSGLGRFKDAVGTGLLGHHAKPPKDGSSGGKPRDTFVNQQTLGISGHDRSGDNKSHVAREDISFSSGDILSFDLRRASTKDFVTAQHRSRPPGVMGPTQIEHIPQQTENSTITIHPQGPKGFEMTDNKIPPIRDLSMSDKAVIRSRTSRLLARHSVQNLHHVADDRAKTQTVRPRHVSFTLVEDLFISQSMVGISLDTVVQTARSAFSHERVLSILLQQMAVQLKQLLTWDLDWVSCKVRNIEELGEYASNDQESFSALQYQKLGEFNRLREAITDLVTEEKGLLTEALKEIEVLGQKLEYELSALQSKVEDVEDGVTDFERHVAELEHKVQGLKHDKARTRPWKWYFTSWLGGAI